MTVDALEHLTVLCLDRDLAELRKVSQREAALRQEIQILRESLNCYDRNNVDPVFSATVERNWLAWTKSRILTLNQKLALVTAEKRHAQENAAKSLARKSSVMTLKSIASAEEYKRSIKFEAERSFSLGVLSRGGRS